MTHPGTEHFVQLADSIVAAVLDEDPAARAEYLRRVPEAFREAHRIAAEVDDPRQHLAAALVALFLLDGANRTRGVLSFALSETARAHAQVWADELHVRAFREQLDQAAAAAGDDPADTA